MTDVVVPHLGVDIEEVIITFWLVKPGEQVFMGAAIAEATADEQPLRIEAPCNGMIAELTASEGESVAVGEVIARMYEEE